MTLQRSLTELGVYCGAGAHEKCRLKAATCGCDCHREGAPMTTATTSVPCPHCDRVCGSGTGLAAHIRSMHPEEADGATGHTPPRANGHKPGVELVWEDPPLRGGRPGVEAKFGALMPELRRAGGRWARLEVFEKKHGANSVTTKCKAVEEWADIEFVARTTENGGSAIYARFKGEDDA